MENEDTKITETESTSTQTPKKAPKRAGNGVDATSEVKAVKPEPKPAWEPNALVLAALSAIAAIDHTDKKGIAQVVKASIDLRTGAKATRDRAEVAGDES